MTNTVKVRATTLMIALALGTIGCAASAPEGSEVTLTYRSADETVTLTAAEWDELIQTGIEQLDAIQADPTVELDYREDGARLDARRGAQWLGLEWEGTDVLHVSTSAGLTEEIAMTNVSPTDRDAVTFAVLGILLSHPTFVDAWSEDGLEPYAYYGRAWRCLNGCDWYDVGCAAWCIVM